MRSTDWDQIEIWPDLVFDWAWAREDARFRVQSLRHLARGLHSLHARLALSRAVTTAQRVASVMQKGARAEWREIRAIIADVVVADDAALDLYALIATLAARGVPQKILLVGPTGAGKTHTALAIARAAGIPHLVIPVHQTVDSGWGGGTHLEEVMGRWSPGVRGDGRGLIVLEELDKITTPPEAHGNAAHKYSRQQAAFLGLLGAATGTLLDSGSWLDTDRMTVIATGAFSDSEWSGVRAPTSQDLIQSGLMPEIVDRLQEVIALDPAPAEALVRIYADESHGAVAGVADAARAMGYALEIEAAMWWYVARAVASGHAGAGPRVGAGWVATAAKRALARALSRGEAPRTVLRIAPDDVVIPPSGPPLKPRGRGDEPPLAPT